MSEITSNNEAEANFIKFSSIENSYNQKYVNYQLRSHPELSTRLYVIQHKYDGSNFQIIFTKNNPIKYASRNKLLVEGEKFFGYKKILPKIDKTVLQRTQKYLDESDTLETIHLFGELYGSAVIKRIKYEAESELNIKFFDVYFDNVVQSPKTFYEWTNTIGIPEDLVVETMTDGPVSLEEALKFNTMSVKTKCNDIIEGVVIKLNEFILKSPKCENEASEDSSEDEGDFYRFVLKLKNSEYVERENMPKASAAAKPKLIKEDNMSEVQRCFSSYVNENRALNAFGKQDWSRGDFKPFVDFVMQDALQDFLKDVLADEFEGVVSEENFRKLKVFQDTQDFKKLRKGFDLPAKNTQLEAFVIAKKIFKQFNIL